MFADELNGTVEMDSENERIKISFGRRLEVRHRLRKVILGTSRNALVHRKATINCR